MKPLKVALIVKNEHGKERLNRNMGYFSYPVPEFEWEHFTPGKRFKLNRSMFRNFDLIFHEDYPYGDFLGSGIPLVFNCIDSTLSPEHFSARFEQAKQADLVLVDHDQLGRFLKTGRPVERFPYCVNDQVFYSKEKSKALDLVFNCSNNHVGGETRKAIRQLLSDYSSENFLQYRSGAIALDQYAENFRSASIVVNQTRTLRNRPHRIFDAMVSGALVLSSKFAWVKEDGLEQGFNYFEYESEADLIEKLDWLFKNPETIRTVASNGYNLIKANHTWEIRARQLRELLKCRLSL